VRELCHKTNPNKKYIKKFQPIVDQINGLEKEFEGFSNEQLKDKTGAFKEEIKQGSFEKGTPLMGISMYGLTADNMIPLQRRSSTVGQSSGKVMFIAGGWMSAMNILGKERFFFHYWLSYSWRRSRKFLARLLSRRLI